MKIEIVTGENVRRFREARGLSQARLGEAIGERTGRTWSRQAVWSAERGQRAFTVSDVLAIALVLDTSVPHLIVPAEQRITEVELGENEIDVDVLLSLFVTGSGLDSAYALLNYTAYRMKLEDVDDHGRLIEERLAAATEALDEAKGLVAEHTLITRDLGKKLGENERALRSRVTAIQREETSEEG